MTPQEITMALDALIDRFRGPLIGLIAAWGASPHDAVELALDTFAEAYLSRMQFRGNWEDEAAVGAWLRGIASNLHKAAVRNANRGSRKIEALGDYDVAEPHPALESDSAHRVRSSMERLQGSWKTVLFMHYIEDSGLRDIAALLGISERSVEGRLRRARAELKSLLEAESEAATAAGSKAAGEGK